MSSGQTARAICSDNSHACSREMVEATIAEIAPRDVLEHMIAAQMIACFDTAMDCFRRAACANPTSSLRFENLVHAGKLARSYALLLDTLDRRRGRGTLTIRIERVNIEPGARAAMVGMVNEALGGAFRPKSESRSYEAGIATAFKSGQASYTGS
jgi:hypothetical protein